MEGQPLLQRAVTVFIVWMLAFQQLPYIKDESGRGRYSPEV